MQGNQLFCFDHKLQAWNTEPRRKKYCLKTMIEDEKETDHESLKIDKN